MNNKNGFTLIEVVLSVSLLSILSIGFVQIFTGSLGIAKKNIAFDKATTTFAHNIDMGDISNTSGTIEIELGGSYSINLDEYTFDDPESSNIFKFYKYTPVVVP